MSFKEQIRDLRIQGRTYNQIVSALGCSKATVSYHCTNLNLPKPLRVKDPSVPLEQEETIRWLLGDGIRSADVSEALDLAPSVVQKFAREFNLVRGRTPDMTNYERVRRRRRHLKMLAVVFKGGCCEICGYRRCFQALDFHHPDPTQKDFTISQNANRAWSQVKSEVQKCQLLCSNCHRETHERNE